MKGRKTVLTEEAKAFIKDNASKMPAKEMANRIGCSQTPIRTYMRRNGLTPPRSVSRKWASEKLKGRTKLTSDQDAILIREYLNLPEKPLAKRLGVSTTCVKARMQTLGLVVPEEIIEKRKRDSRIKPGSTPPNKGLRQKDYMTPQQIEKTKATRFKKGALPPNTIHEKSPVRTRKDSNGRNYNWIKIKHGQWVMLHVHNWVKVNGPLPKGKILWFRDGNSLNAEISNLELITRAENIRRNRASFLALPEGLKETISLNNKLKKKIKDHVWE